MAQHINSATRGGNCTVSPLYDAYHTPRAPRAYGAVAAALPRAIYFFQRNALPALLPVALAENWTANLPRDCVEEQTRARTVPRWLAPYGAITTATILSPPDVPRRFLPPFPMRAAPGDMAERRRPSPRAGGRTFAFIYGPPPVNLFDKRIAASSSMSPS